MNKTLVIGLAVGFVTFGIIGTAISASNTANRFEKTIKASHRDSENILGQYAPKLAEQIGVSKLQANAVRDIISGANETRYGEQGSQASIQWIQEQNPTLDQSNYRVILETIEAGRNDFKIKQTMKIDQLREYETALGNIPGGLMMKLTGWPSEDFFEKYEVIIVSDHAGKAFETGRDNGLDISKM